MKRLFLLSTVLFLLCSCSNDDGLKPGQPDGENTAMIPHFYGMARLENPAPETRGVANTQKVWHKSMAKEKLTVKFLNGTERYQAQVKEVVREWEKAAGVRFNFVKDDQDALIRVGFDYIPGMMSSWAITGTDHLQLYDQQQEPTIHFARWRRSPDQLKYSDVLRAFGQALGLELEFRHPTFDPGWITDENGNVDEARIREYWERELKNYITWEELKKMVLDPLQDQPSLIYKTDSYDPESVMTWPLYEMIAKNIPLIEFEDDYKTELSALDKKFIQEIYGPTLGEFYPEDRYLNLIEFDYTGTTPEFTLTTNKNIAVIWDQDAEEATNYYLPTNVSTEYTFTATHTFAENKKHRIIIAEFLDWGQEIPTESTALTAFDLTHGVGAENFDIKLLNKALESIRIIGGEGFISQEFNFTGYNNLRELYLVGTLDSRVTLENCENLEIFATSRSVYKPQTLKGPSGLTVASTPEANGYYKVEGPVAEWANESISIPEGIGKAEPTYSLSDLNGPGITIRNCGNLKEISLENTRVKNIDFSNLPHLEYIYLSSTQSYLVSGGSKDNNGEYLCAAFSTLENRKDLPSGVIVLRGITRGTNPADYMYVFLNLEKFIQIDNQFKSKNWTAVWDSGLLLFAVAIP
ncbi:hypothetical protein [Odoribacter laneus]|uniref:hypothetical protein n=1 Tax=Odoribacter laneus TaxID=626933 RepID=UPI0023F51520|nr:hypothetical protein [Odoribacter laneus]